MNLCSCVLDIAPSESTFYLPPPDFQDMDNGNNSSGLSAGALQVGLDFKSVITNHLSLWTAVTEQVLSGCNHFFMGITLIYKMRALS